MDNPPPFRKLFLHNIDFHASNDDIYNVFSKYGKIKSVQVPRNKDGQHRGMGFVEFETHEAA